MFPRFSYDFIKFRRCGANIGNLHHGLLEAKILMDPAERADFNRKVALLNRRLLICTMPLRTSLYLLQSGFQQKCINY